MINKNVLFPFKQQCFNQKKLNLIVLHNLHTNLHVVLKIVVLLMLVKLANKKVTKNQSTT